MRELALKLEVVIRDAPHSAVELNALGDRIVEEFDYWQDQGIRVNTLSPRFDGTA